VRQAVSGHLSALPCRALLSFFLSFFLSSPRLPVESAFWLPYWYVLLTQSACLSVLSLWFMIDEVGLGSLATKTMFVRALSECEWKENGVRAVLLMDCTNDCLSLRRKGLIVCLLIYYSTAFFPSFLPSYLLSYQNVISFLDPVPSPFRFCFFVLLLRLPRCMSFWKDV